MCEALRIELDEEALPLRPGGVVRGEVLVSGDARPRDVELQLLLAASVGEHAVEIALEGTTLEAPAAAEDGDDGQRRPFSLALPAAKRPFVGELLTLRLDLKAAAGRRDVTRRSLAIEPDPAERLQIVPPAAARGDYRGLPRRLFALAAGPLGLAGLCALGGAAGLGGLYVVAVLVGGLGIGLGAGAWGRYRDLRDAPRLFAVTVEHAAEGSYRSAARGERLRVQLDYGPKSELRGATATLEVRERVQLVPELNRPILGGDEKARAKPHLTTLFCHELALEPRGEAGHHEGVLDVPAGEGLPPSFTLRHEQGRFEGTIAWVLVLEAELSDGGRWRHELPLHAQPP